MQSEKVTPLELEKEKLNSRDFRLALYAILAVILAPLVTYLAALAIDKFELSPYLPGKSTFYTALAVAGLCVGLWIVWKNAKSAKNQTPLNDTVVTLTGAGGIVMALCSMGLSTSFGYTLGGNHFALPFVFACVLAVISIAEFVAAYWLEHFLTKRSAGLFLVACVLLVIGVTTSILAGQALIAGQVDAAKSERIQASDTYQSYKNQLASAQQKAQDLSVSTEAAQEAQQAIDLLMAQASNAISNNRTYADCSAFPNGNCVAKGAYYSRTDTLNNQLAPIQQQIAKQQAIINQYNDYQGALSYVSTLESKPLPQAVNGDLPHVVWLATLTGAEPSVIEAKIYVFLAVISEFVGLVLLYFYGQGTRANSGLSIANVTLNNPIPQMKVGGYVNTDGLVYLHANELVLTEEETREYLASKRAKEQAATAPPIEPYRATPTAPHVPRYDRATVSSINNLHAPKKRTSAPSTTTKTEIKTEFVGRERVAKDVSGIAGKGRVGKVDSCKCCGKDYLVKAYNQVHCKPCSDAKQSGYKRSK